MDFVHTLLEVDGLDEDTIYDVLEPYWDEGLVEVTVDDKDVMMIWKDDYAYDDAIADLERDMSSAGGKIGYSGYE